MAIATEGVRFGLQGSGQLVEGTPDPGLFRALAELAESAGYDSLWAGDHVSFHNPIVDVVVALTTFAAVTERIAIGAGVVLLPLRHPSLVAKEFASLDYLSGGRVVLGVGVGGEGGKDFEAVGVPIGERGARTDEAMLALRALFSEREASFTGRYFRFEGITIEPGSPQPGGPPLWVGGRAAPALRRAGRLGDGWMPIWVSPERFAEGWTAIRRHALDAARDPDALVPAVVVPSRIDDDGDRARRSTAEHLARRYGMEVEEHLVRRYCVAGTPEECAARIGDYVASGARHVIFNLCAGPGDSFEQAERLYVEVAAGVAA
jgi:probable F420-dependent oxidoreductase